MPHHTSFVIHQLMTSDFMALAGKAEDFCNPQYLWSERNVIYLYEFIGSFFMTQSNNQVFCSHGLLFFVAMLGNSKLVD